tara:strand:- start:276 stop:1109 length:834 start_codon:yes stop_codon:yes gene_type:complete
LKQDWSNLKKNGWSFLNVDSIHYEWTIEAKKQLETKFHQKLFDFKNLRCGSTWFVGTNFLDNSSNGSIGAKLMSKKIFGNILKKFGSNIKYWDKGQVSICWPGYPKKDAKETEKSFNFRIKRFASHIDGIIPFGSKKRRFAKEFHAFILGFPIQNNCLECAPLVVWEGSHKIFRNFFKEIYEGVTSNKISSIDITELYNECRKKVFTNCEVKKIIPQFNQPYLLDRHILHGIHNWKEKNNIKLNTKNNRSLNSISDGRVIIYFRPVFFDPLDWINIE